MSSSPCQQVKKRVAVVFVAEIFVPHYELSGSLEDLAASCELTVVYANDIQETPKFFDSQHTEYYEPHLRNRQINAKIFNILTWTNRTKSSSFRFRIARKNHLVLSDLRPLNNRVYRMFRISKRLLYWISVITTNSLRHNRLIAPALLKWYQARISPNNSLLECVGTDNYDLIICPVSGFDPDAFDLLDVCATSNIKTLFVVDNWDNVSSKTIYWKKPTHIAVWGEQSLNHAIQIHDFTEKQVSVIGAPRYSNYFKDRLDNLQSPTDFPYILFLGTALYFDEYSCLVKLNEIVRLNQALCPNLRILYRPHPFRQSFQSTHEVLPEYVTLDASSSQKEDVNGKGYTPNLDHFSRILQNCEFAVGGLTSMLIEAAIFGKDFLALVHDDKVNFTSQHNALSSYEHFADLHKLETVHFLHHLKDLNFAFQYLLSRRGAKDFARIDASRNYFLFDDGREFSRRLLDLSLQVIDGKNS
jgi:hypothetical protein